MLVHMRDHTGDISKEADMAELVDLVMSDGLDGELFADILEVIRRSRKGRNAAARESDLGRGGKLIDQIRIAHAFAFRQDLDQIILIKVIEVMDTVGIVPEDTEVFRCRLEPCKAADCLITVGIACRIRIFGNAPDALDGLVFRNKLFDHIHIRASGAHGNRDHADPEVFGDGKMSVVAGYRAKEIHLVQFSPGCVAHDTMCHCAGDRIIHDIEGGVAIDNDIIRAVLHHIADQVLALFNSVQYTVVAAVCSVFTEHIRVRIEDIHDPHGQIQLLQAGFSPGHIQVQIHVLIFFVLLFQICKLFGEFFIGHFYIRFQISLLLYLLCAGGDSLLPHFKTRRFSSPCLR